MRNPSTDAAGKLGAGKSTPCCSKVGLKRGPWTPEEDQVLADYIAREGQGRWRTLPKRAGLLRCGKSCRLRWMNYLRPSVKRGQIAPDEEDLILRLHRLLGNRWSLIAGRIPGRTDNEIKNYWNTHLSKKLINQGIDPRTHKPLDLEIAHEMNNKSKTTTDTHKANQLLIQPQQSNSGGILEEEAPFSFDPMGHSRMAAGGVNDEECVDPDYCTEDVFSSFLNSLINEDLHTYQNEQQQQMMIPHYDALLSQPTASSAAMAFTSAGWEAPLMATSDTTPPDQGHA